jgi:hypothetical protein
MSKIEKPIDQLNAEKKSDRLEALKQLIALENSGDLAKPAITDSCNNHIHTIYSFSPYSPTKALWMARNAGLVTAGIMDHDSVGGCDEFVKAGEIAQMPITCGFECRADCSGTPLAGRRINNPDQKSVAYVAIHGIPHQNISMCEELLSPFRANRNIRNRKMTEKLNNVVAPLGVSIDFDKDIMPLSQSNDGGSITERHILFALSKRIVETFGKGERIVAMLKTKLNMNLSSKIEAMLCDIDNPYYEYDLLSAMKSDLVASFYIDATDECPHITDYIAFAKKCGGISAYAYLGDVSDSVTGDKKTQKFEDDYLDLLFEVLGELNFNAITYMPSRNTPPQLKRIMMLCKKYDLFEISGEDINSPRQSFIYEALNKPEFKHLSVATWALIGHEKEATKDITKAMFSKETSSAMPALQSRIEFYSGIARK